MRKCEICGNSDFELFIASSAIGAFSMAYCPFCASLNAELVGMIEATGVPKEEFSKSITYYDKKSDTYRFYYNDEIVEITINNKVYTKREEAAKAYREAGG